MRKFLGLTGLTVGAGLLASGAVVGGTARAQNVSSDVPATSVIEDIVVTATRRSENLQDVPISVQVLSSSQLTAHSVYDVGSLAAVIPGLTSVASTGSTATPSFTIRGRGLNYGASTGSVETYFAEVPLSSPFNIPQLPPQFFDLKSVQVLKGPQGTLFGRNTTGGAVLLVPQDPTDEFEGYARVQGGNYGNFQFEGALNLPLLSDKAALRLAVFRWSRDGYSRTVGGLPDNLTDRILPSQTYDNQDVSEFRATLHVRPFDGFENSTIVTYHEDQNRGNGKTIVANPALVNATLGIAFEDFYNQPANNPRVSQTSVSLDHPANEHWGIINTTTIKPGANITVKNIISYIEAKGYTQQGIDADGTALPIADLVLPAHPLRNEQFTEELQVQGESFDDRLSWTLGGVIDRTRQPSLDKGMNQFATLVYFGAVLQGVWAQTNIESEGLFGSVNYKITDNLNLTAGYRHVWDHVDVNVVNYQGLLTTATYGTSILPQIANANTYSAIAALPDAVSQGAFHPKLSKTWNGDLWNVGLDYHPTDKVMVYGGYRRGFKRGGFNLSAPPTAPAFAPETVDDFYAGVKSDFDIARVPIRLNVEGFYDIYHKNQVSTVVVEGISGCTVGICVMTENVPKTIYRGADLDFTALPSHWLDISGSYSFLDAYSSVRHVS